MMYAKTIQLYPLIWDKINMESNGNHSRVYLLLRATVYVNSQT